MRAVVFDFDGTITYKSKNLWKMIWQECGYDLGEGSVYKEYYNDFMSGKYSYEVWCDKTCQLFRERNFNYNQFINLSKNFNIIDGFEDVLKYLKNRGVRLYILSGSIVEGIEVALGKWAKLFDKISANKMIFDDKGIIERIDATNFDFKGKADYINGICQELKCKPKDVVFVGNDNNDDEVYKSGCSTICFNPNMADYSNREKWHFVIEHSSNFNDLMEFLIKL